MTCISQFASPERAPSAVESGAFFAIGDSLCPIVHFDFEAVQSYLGAVSADDTYLQNGY